jgi:dienelactone hydrolase
MKIVGLLATTVALWVLASLNAVAQTSPVGTWYFKHNEDRLTAQIFFNPKTSRHEGNIVDSRGNKSNLKSIFWSLKNNTLAFVRPLDSNTSEWYEGRVVEGVFQGRVASGSTIPSFPYDYTTVATGWSATYLDSLSTVRVFDLTIDGFYKARLTLDRNAGRVQGLLKVYSTVTGDIALEEPEYDLTNVVWSGDRISFTRRLADATQYFEGTISGRSIYGRFRHGTDAFREWTGVRANVLSYGLFARTPAQRLAWQTRTRRQLQHLLMKGNPNPSSVRVTTIRTNMAPPGVGSYRLWHDWNALAHPRNYRLKELNFRYEIPNPYGGAPAIRIVHGYLAMPNDYRVGERLPTLLAVNGHGGSALSCFRIEDFNYGDAFASRRYLVLAIDISHRPDSPFGYPLEDRVGGTHITADGCHPHPSIKYPGLDASDWEEDGERVWDSMRAIDYLRTLPEADPNRIAMIGLSMGGEVTTYTAALDQRIRVAIPTGYAMESLKNNPNTNHICWMWNNADIGDYVDTSDFHALMAPRKVIYQTGSHDATFSIMAPPFATDKQIARRARIAYDADSTGYVHYLQIHREGFPGHITRYGDIFTRSPKEARLTVTVPTLTGPTSTGSPAWQTDPTTRPTGLSVFEIVENWFR